MHFVPVHLELLQLTHFLSHIDARADAGAVYDVNNRTALHVKKIRARDRALKALVKAMFIPGSCVD